CILYLTHPDKLMSLTWLKCSGFFINGVNMKYTKPALSYEQQAIKLIDRGLLANKDGLIAVLQRVNYYRLTFYLYPYRVNNSDCYKKGNNFK
ncbi:MAG: hypothetical protein K8R40_09405, partial [Anaerolineaceae bacterium]|nr:hypothetical protein [Anaerolineaceae bacterium]